MIKTQVKEIPYPSSRRFTFDFGKIGRDKPHVRALLEVVVTDALTKIRLNRRSGKKASFLAWLIKLVADYVQFILRSMELIAQIKTKYWYLTM